MTTQLCQICGMVPATQGFYGRMVCNSCREVLLEPSKLFAEQQKVLESIAAKDSRFSGEVYEFVAEAMEAAFSEGSLKHSTGSDLISPETRKDKEAPAGQLAEMKMPSKSLVVALQRLASERFGKCATATFNSWGITRWQDFAEVVSRMQEANVLLFSILAFNRDDFKSRGVLDDVFPER